MDKREIEALDNHIYGDQDQYLLGGSEPEEGVGVNLPKGDSASDVMAAARSFSERIREMAGLIADNLRDAADTIGDVTFPVLKYGPDPRPRPMPMLIHGDALSMPDAQHFFIDKGNKLTEIPPANRLQFQPDPMGQQLVELSEWFDGHNAGRDPEAVTWGRLAKIAEEAGEVVEAFIAYTGQNPRKDRGTSAEVAKELLDVAVTALAAYEHLTSHEERAIPALRTHVQGLYDRMEDSRQEKCEEEPEAACVCGPHPWAYDLPSLALRSECPVHGGDV